MALGDPVAVLGPLDEPTTSFLLPPQLRRDGRRAAGLVPGENRLVGATVFDSLGRTLFVNGGLRDLLKVRLDLLRVLRVRFFVRSLHDLGAQLAGESTPVALSLLLELAVKLTEVRVVRSTAAGHSLPRLTRFRRLFPGACLLVASRLVLTGC